jgi:RND family efflux transporter MFP subunit
MQRLPSYLIILFAVVAMASCGARTEPLRKIESTAIPVRVMPVNEYNALEKIPVSGQFTTDDEVMLSFKTTGIINKIFVKEGDAIKKGELLATLNLTEIDASLQQAQLSYEKTNRDLQRLNNLYIDSVATLEQVQNGKTNRDLAAQQLNTARFNRQYSEIRAEANGYVLRKLANEGQLVNSGNPVLQTNGAGSGKWILRAGVTDKQWTVIKTGESAEIRVASRAGQTLAGKVTRKSESVDPSNGLFSIDVTLSNKQPGNIAAGMFGTGVISEIEHPTAEKSGNETWSVPYEALLDGDGSSGFVFVTNDNKTARKVKVTIAGVEKDHVIVSQGLEKTKFLIVSGSAYLTDNSTIQIIP